jgi:hypothetical protein
MAEQVKKISIPFFFGIVLMPYVFSWLLLQNGYSKKARIIGLGWAAIVILPLYFALTQSTSGTTIQSNPPTTNQAQPLASNSPAKPLIAKPTAPLALWGYETNDDKMRNTTTKYATVSSTNILHFEFPYSGGSTGEISLRKSGRSGNDAMLRISKGQFVCSTECTISAKFDDGKVEKYSVVEPSDGSSDTLFIQSYDRFVSKLKKSNKLVIEAEFYQAGLQQIEFKTYGLEWK